MADLSDGFIALPGGVGTLEEILKFGPGQQGFMPSLWCRTGC